MKQWARKQSGFTIVELLIVIVVIAVLAAITIVAYNGIRDRATNSSVQSALSQATKKVLSYATINSDQYPADLATAGISDSGGTTYQFTSNNTVSPRTFCVTATVSDISYYSSQASSVASSGICPGHNIIVWDKARPSTNPVPTATIDSSVFRSSTASMRLAPGQVGMPLRSSPYTGNVGQVVTTRLWMITDAGWNGTATNSKIRIFSSPGGVYIAQCTYNGVKLTWTQVTCPHTITSTYTTIGISVGNDGTAGNIWLDDVSVGIE